MIWNMNQYLEPRSCMLNALTNLIDLTDNEKQIIEKFRKYPLLLEMWDDILVLQPFEILTIQKDKKGNPKWYQLDKKQRKEFKL